MSSKQRCVGAVGWVLRIEDEEGAFGRGGEDEVSGGGVLLGEGGGRSTSGRNGEASGEDSSVS